MKTIRTGISVAMTLALASLLAGPASAEISFSYAEANYINVDTNLAGRITDTAANTDVRLGTSDDSGFEVGGAWEFYRNVHVFGEYSKAKNDVGITGTVLGVPLNASGDFDVIRWRAGLGYAYPINEVLTAYGQVSYDYIEFDNFDLSDGDGSLNTDDSGAGVEGGLRFAPFEPSELYAYVRYSSVGDFEVDSNSGFSDDILYGFGGRFFVTDRIGLQIGYEVGQIDTLNVGARFTF
ncbi:MAG: hypothetical protein WBN31_05185 [Gammaproteobacteria bacterium]